MYEQFFGFRESPFRVTPDPRFLYHNPCYDEAIAALSYGIEQRKGFITLVGEVGTGKTTLLRHLLDTIAPNVRTVLLLYPTVSFTEILEQILVELGIPVEGARKGAMLQRLHEFLLEHTASGGNVALLFDEAQALDASTLEELRLLSNLETGSEKIVQLVLAGQPEFENRLRQPEHRQLRQRVALHIRLRPLAADEVAAYVRTRLQHAGAPDLGVFEPDALARIGEVTGGIPRIVNVLCDTCCTTALARESPHITRAIVDEAWSDFEGLLPETVDGEPAAIPGSGVPTPVAPATPTPPAPAPVAPAPVVAPAAPAPPMATPPPQPTPPPVAETPAAMAAPPPPPPRPFAPPPPVRRPPPGSRDVGPPSTAMLVGGALLAAAIGAFLAFRIGRPDQEEFAPPVPMDTPAVSRFPPTPAGPAPTTPSATTPTVAVEPAVERPSAMEALDVVDAFRAAYESQDLSAIASLFTPDATKGEIVGRDDIVADYQRFFEGTSDIFYAQPSASVEPRADHVLVRAPFEITYRDSAGRPVEVRGLAMWKIVKLGASARIAALDFQLDPVLAR